MDVPVDVFFTAGFSEEATYTPPSGPLKTVRVVFDNEYGQTVLGGVIIENSDPTAYVRTADVPDITNAASLSVRGTTYRVKEIRPDGQGITVLILSKRNVN